MVVALLNFDILSRFFYITVAFWFKKTIFNIFANCIEYLRYVCVLFGTAFDEFDPVLIG